eukprot:5881395-Amphidinium_carterae.1
MFECPKLDDTNQHSIKIGRQVTWPKLLFWGMSTSIGRPYLPKLPSQRSRNARPWSNFSQPPPTRGALMSTSKDHQLGKQNGSYLLYPLPL